MRTSTAQRAVAAIAAALPALLVPAIPAHASARDAAVTGVYSTASCAGGRCTPGSDTPLQAGASAAGTLQVFVTAKADLGLEFVRLEAQSGSDPAFYCIEFWKTNGALEFSNNRVWKTHRWTDPRQQCEPEICSGCLENSDHQHGIPTANGTYNLRVVAREQGQFTDANDAKSPLFAIKLSNAPTAPAWIGEPASNGKPDSSVVLRWSPSPEPDIVEYQFVREDPDGTERVFAVSAGNPERNGCSRASDVAYSCANGGLTRSGTYRYALRALRHGAGGRCAITGASCVASKVGAVRSASVVVAAVPAGTTPAGSGSASASPAGTLPGQEPLALPDRTGTRPGDGLIAPPDSTPAGSTGSGGPAIAAAVLALAVALGIAVKGRIIRKGVEP